MKSDHAGSAEQPRICFLSKQSPARYKELDYEILSRHFPVIRHDYAYTLQNFRLFKETLGKVDLVFSWFANPWLALLAPMIPKGIKLVVVAGGYDVGYCREIKYGARLKPVQGYLTRRLLRRADVVISVSEYNQREFSSLVPGKESRLVYNAVDFPAFSILTKMDRPRKVITIGAINRRVSLRKGHFRFIQTARQLPDYEFVLVGKKMDRTYDKLVRLAPANVRFAGFLSREEMLGELLSSSIYLQLSYHEAFGVSVAEAMACGCYPVVADGTALPEIVRDVGAVVPGNDLNRVIETVRAAVEEQRYRQVNPEPAKQKFGVEQREKALVDVIKEIGIE